MILFAALLFECPYYMLVNADTGGPHKVKSIMEINFEERGAP